MITLNKYDINRECGSMTEQGCFNTEFYIATKNVYGMWDDYGVTSILRGGVRNIVITIQLPIMLQLRSLYNQYS